MRKGNPGHLGQGAGGGPDNYITRVTCQIGLAQDRLYSRDRPIGSCHCPWGNINALICSILSPNHLVLLSLAGMLLHQAGVCEPPQSGLKWLIELNVAGYSITCVTFPVYKQQDSTFGCSILSLALPMSISSVSYLAKCLDSKEQWPVFVSTLLRHLKWPSRECSRVLLFK